MERTAIGTIVRGGTIVTATDRFVADILIENGTIAALAASIPGSGPDVVDASGSYVFPGFIDPHTHLDMPFGGTTSADDFESGTRSAAFGGTTCVVDFAIQPQGGSLKVVSTHMRPGYLQKNGVPYSANAVLTEYFSRTAEPNGDSWLIVTHIVEDPQYLTQPFIRSTHFKKLLDSASISWAPEACSAR